MPMTHQILHLPLASTAVGLLLSIGLVAFVSSCGKKNTEEATKAETPATSVVETSEGTVSTAVGTPATAGEKKVKGPQTHREYTAELGKAAKENQSFARRVAMAQEILNAREKVLEEKSEDIRAIRADIETRKAALAAAQQALADAEKALADAYAKDPDWAAARKKVDAVEAEQQAAMARTMAAINDARRKGIHLKPQDIQEPSAPAETPTAAPAPVDLTLPTESAAPGDAPAAPEESAAPTEATLPEP